jgi:hypothetical protein
LLITDAWKRLKRPPHAETAVQVRQRIARTSGKAAQGETILEPILQNRL